MPMVRYRINSVSRDPPADPADKERHESDTPVLAIRINFAQGKTYVENRYHDDQLAIWQRVISGAGAGLVARLEARPGLVA